MDAPRTGDPRSNSSGIPNVAKIIRNNLRNVGIAVAVYNFACDAYQRTRDAYGTSLSRDSWRFAVRLGEAEIGLKESLESVQHCLLNVETRFRQLTENERSTPQAIRVAADVAQAVTAVEDIARVLGVALRALAPRRAAITLVPMPTPTLPRPIVAAPKRLTAVPFLRPGRTDHKSPIPTIHEERRTASSPASSTSRRPDSPGPVAGGSSEGNRSRG
jgi:hypothetical protein